MLLLFKTMVSHGRGHTLIWRFKGIYLITIRKILQEIT